MELKLKGREKSKQSISLVTHYNPQEVISEQYRLIRTNILFSSIDKEIKSIIVTSPEPSDGKSTTAANLAVVLAQQGKRVILVDSDLRRPSLHYSFRVSNLVGLTNVLRKEELLLDAIAQTDVSNLEVLTSGDIPPNPSELLNTKAMEHLMKELKAMYDFVVYDTPPLIAVTDAQIIANRCDGVVMVVASGKTHKQSALRAKEMLETAKAKILGVVLNGTETKAADGYSKYS